VETITSKLEKREALLSDPVEGDLEVTVQTCIDLYQQKSFVL
jgi:hypothetical protein